MEFTFVYLTKYPFLGISAIGAVPTNKSNKLLTYATCTVQPSKENMYEVSAICHYIESSNVPVIWLLTNNNIHRAMLCNSDKAKIHRDHTVEYNNKMSLYRWRKQLEIMDYLKLLSITG